MTNRQSTTLPACRQVGNLPTACGLAGQAGRKFSGFTLIELLVVIAIISLLVSILLPSLNRAKDLARRAMCASNLRNCGTSLFLYAGDNGGTLPCRYNWSTCYSHEASGGTQTYANGGLLVHGKYAPLGTFFSPGKIGWTGGDEYLDYDGTAHWWFLNSYWYLQFPTSDSRIWNADAGGTFGVNSGQPARISIHDLWTTVLMANQIYGRYGWIMGFRHGYSGANALYIDGSAHWVEDPRLYETVEEGCETTGGPELHDQIAELWGYLEEGR